MTDQPKLQTEKRWEGAFPAGRYENGEPVEYGMSKREFYAAKIIAAFCSNPSIFQPNGMSGWGLVNCKESHLVGYAFQIADEMIEAGK